MLLLISYFSVLFNLVEAEDAGISDLELRELFLPSDLMEPGDVCIPNPCLNKLFH